MSAVCKSGTLLLLLLLRIKAEFYFRLKLHDYYYYRDTINTPNKQNPIRIKTHQQLELKCVLKSITTIPHTDWILIFEPCA